MTYCVCYNMFLVKLNSNISSLACLLFDYAAFVAIFYHIQIKKGVWAK